jgi:hypothetical protein
MTGLKKCDAFFLIGGGAAVVITNGLTRFGVDRFSPTPFERFSALKRGARARAETSTSCPVGLRGAV